MNKKNQIFEILKISSPTNRELAKIIFGKDTYNNRGHVRKLISDIRWDKNVTIIPDAYGHYNMSHLYTVDDERWQNRLVLSKQGRPRRVV